MGNKFFNWVNNKVKKTDRFGVPILLNYKGENSYKTTIGGIWSIIINAILAAYSIVLLMQMINRDGSVINSTIKVKNLMYDSTKYIPLQYLSQFSVEPTFLPNLLG